MFSLRTWLVDEKTYSEGPNWTRKKKEFYIEGFCPDTDKVYLPKRRNFTYVSNPSLLDFSLH